MRSSAADCGFPALPSPPAAAAAGPAARLFSPADICSQLNMHLYGLSPTSQAWIAWTCKHTRTLGSILYLLSFAESALCLLVALCMQLLEALCGRQAACPQGLWQACRPLLCGGSGIGLRTSVAGCRGSTLLGRNCSCFFASRCILQQLMWSLNAVAIQLKG